MLKGDNKVPLQMRLRFPVRSGVKCSSLSGHPRNLAFVLIILVLAFAMEGCVSQNKRKSVEFDPDFSEKIVPFHTEVVPREHKDYAWYELKRGSLFFYNGDCYHSDIRFDAALEVMQELASDEREASAVVIAEQQRTFRGEPYERATAYLYRGLCKFNQGNYEAALAAFRASLESDKETRNEDGSLLEDYYVAAFLAAITYERLGEHDNAVAMLALAHEHNPEAVILQDKTLEYNFIALIETGEGPFPVQGAAWNKDYRSRNSPEQRVKIVIDGAESGQVWEATDLFIQASSNDFGAADSAALGRGIGKAIISGLIAGLTGVNPNIDEHRDLRHWPTLPRKFFIFAADLDPGIHQMKLHFYDGEDNHLERYEQLWYEVPVYKTAERIFWAKARADLHNRYDMEEKPLLEAIDAKRTELNETE